MKLQQAFETQAKACAELGSPFTARLLRALPPLLRPGSALYDRLADWPGDIGPAGASLPLRLAGAFHSLVLLGNAPELIDVFPPKHASDAAFVAALEGALRDHGGHIDAWINSPPQTNEVRRSAILIAAAQGLAARFGLPFVLSELGASAGLNLMWDKYQLGVAGRRYGPEAPALTLAPDWTGPAPPAALCHIAERRGVDLSPIDPASEEGKLRLLSYLWADQSDRIERTRAAIGVADAPVDAADAADWLKGRLTPPRDGQLHLIFHTVAWQYFPQSVQSEARGLIEAKGAKATNRRPLAWLSMENDGTTAAGAELTLRLWPGDEMHRLGRADFHGRWVNWSPGRAFDKDKRSGLG